MMDVFKLVELLHKKHLFLSTAESCTGGLLAGKLIEVPGASDVYSEGFITYSNRAKEERLGVLGTTLKAHGAVSAECAAEMAREQQGSAILISDYRRLVLPAPEADLPTNPSGLSISVFLITERPERLNAVLKETEAVYVLKL